MFCNKSESDNGKDEGNKLENVLHQEHGFKVGDRRPGDEVRLTAECKGLLNWFDRSVHNAPHQGELDSNFFLMP